MAADTRRERERGERRERRERREREETEGVAAAMMTGLGMQLGTKRGLATTTRGKRSGVTFGIQYR